MPPICGAEMMIPGRRCGLTEGHGGYCRYVLPAEKKTKKQRIAELEYAVDKRDRKIENLIANEQGSSESHARKNARIAELEEELAHQIGKVERSQERHARRTERDTALSEKVSKLEVERLQLMRARDIASGERDSAVRELRVERGRHDDAKAVVTDLRNLVNKLQQTCDSLRQDVEIAEESHLVVQQTVNDLRRELEAEREKIASRDADVTYWQDRSREGMRGASTPSILAEVARRIEK